MEYFRFSGGKCPTNSEGHQGLQPAGPVPGKQGGGRHHKRRREEQDAPPGGTALRIWRLQVSF